MRLSSDSIFVPSVFAIGFVFVNVSFSIVVDVVVIVIVVIFVISVFFFIIFIVASASINDAFDAVDFIAAINAFVKKANVDNWSPRLLMLFAWRAVAIEMGASVALPREGMLKMVEEREEKEEMEEYVFSLKCVP